MTPDEERLLLRDIAIAACERLGNGLVSGSPTAVRLSEDMNPDAAPPDVDIVAYTAFLADEEDDELRDRNADPDDAWLGRFTYDLEHPCLTTAAAVEYRRLRDERLSTEFDINIELLGRINLAQKDSQKTREPDYWPDTGDESEPEYEISEHSTGLRKDAPDQFEATAKDSQDTDAVTKSGANRRAKGIADPLALRRDEINLQLMRLCTAEGDGVISPIASDHGLIAWALIRVNKPLIKNEFLHRRARKQLIEASTPADANATKNAARQGKEVTKKRGGQKKTARDIELWNKYREGLEQARWLEVSQFAKEVGMRADTTRAALKRGEAAKAKLDEK